jgi:DNA-binding NarL/FixJ family response regulator
VTTTPTNPPVDLADTQQQVGGRVSRPIRVSLVNDFEIVVRGLDTMLRPFKDRIVIVEREVGGTPDEHADIALFDTFAGRREALDRAGLMLRQGLVDHVVLYTWDAGAPFLEAAYEIGVSAVISKSVASCDLVDAMTRVVAGERLGLEHVVRRGRLGMSSMQLSEREREVLALLAQGLSNREIAHELYLSLDTIKTHVRRVFSKIGVTNRTQAALHAVEHALVPRRDGPRDSVGDSVRPLGPGELSLLP